MSLSFIDETKKTKQKQTQNKLIAQITKNQKKRRLRKQLHNTGLLNNYFEWEKHEPVAVLKYKINHKYNYAWISGETVGCVAPQNKENNKNCTRVRPPLVLVSDYFGLKLDVEDFIASYNLQMKLSQQTLSSTTQQPHCQL